MRATGVIDWRSWLCVVAMGVNVVPLAAAGAAFEEPAPPPQVIRPEAAADHIGQTRTVEMQVRSARKGDSPICFLNSETDHRDAKNFTAIIFKEGLAKFKSLGVESPEQHFKEKQIRVTGKIESYRGHPQIRIEDPKQIEIVKPPAGASPQPQ